MTHARYTQGAHDHDLSLQCLDASGAARNADEAAPPRDVHEGAGEEEAAEFTVGSALACERSAGIWNAAADPDHSGPPTASGEKALNNIFDCHFDQLLKF